MAFVHGKVSTTSWNSQDISGFVDSVTYAKATDTHDVTTKGKDSRVFIAGLVNRTVQLSGYYDNGASNTPRTLFDQDDGTAKTWLWKPEGDGTGLPQKSVSAICSNYQEESPIDDKIAWSVDLQCSDDATDSAQA